VGSFSGRQATISGAVVFLPSCRDKCSNLWRRKNKNLISFEIKMMFFNVEFVAQMLKREINEID
jgi:hypothetical protein